DEQSRVKPPTRWLTCRARPRPSSSSSIFTGDRFKDEDEGRGRGRFVNASGKSCDRRRKYVSNLFTLELFGELCYLATRNKSTCQRAKSFRQFRRQFRWSTFTGMARSDCNLAGRLRSLARFFCSAITLGVLAPWVSHG